MCLLRGSRSFGMASRGRISSRRDEVLGLGSWTQMQVCSLNTRRSRGWANKRGVGEGGELVWFSRVSMFRGDLTLGCNFGFRFWADVDAMGVRGSSRV